VPVNCWPGDWGAARVVSARKAKVRMRESMLKVFRAQLKISRNISWGRKELGAK
jgi:hypothetical protein